MNRVVAGLFLLASLQGCNPSEEPVVAPAFDAQLLTSTTEWRRTSIMRQETNQTVNVLATLDACRQDDLFAFGADGSYQIKEGESKCQPNAQAVVEAGTWSIMGSLLQLAPQVGDTYGFTITLLEPGRLECNTVQLGANGQVVSVTRYVFRAALVP
jgi:hypothetical protein